MTNWMPKVKEQPDGSYVFELKDEVFLRLLQHSEKKLEVWMWRPNMMLVRDTGNLAAASFRDKLVQLARDTFDEPDERDEKGNVTKPAKVNVPNIAECILAVAAIICQRGSDGKSIEEKLQEKEGASLVEQLISFAEERGEFFHTPEREAHASVERNSHTETYPLHSRGFRLWLKGAFRAHMKERNENAALAAREQLVEQLGPLFDDSAPIVVERPPIVREQTFADALSELESLAINDGEELEVNLRAAQGLDGKIYLDLCNEEWEVVEVSAEGWRIITDPPVKFIRSNTMLPQQRPQRGGSLEEFREILTLSDDDEDDKGAWRLICAWLVQALRPNGGQYPILVLLGGQGSAKTTTARMIRRLVDPNVLKDTSPPKNEHDLYIDATNKWVIAIDNLSTLPKWLSDAICRISTDGGFGTRKLYTGREQEVFDALRPFILNGIADVAREPDILDRALLINLPSIRGKKPLRKVWADFDEAQPRIFGALLDAMVAGLATDLDLVDVDGEMPRLADFAQWAVATEVALGGEPGSFMKAYKDSRGEATHTILEADPIAEHVRSFAKDYPEPQEWIDSATALLAKLNKLETSDDVKREKAWPKRANILSARLEKLRPSLAEEGVIAERTKSNGKRALRVAYRPPRDDSRDARGGAPEETVPEENPIDIGKSADRDDRDDRDDPINSPEDEKFWGEV